MHAPFTEGGMDKIVTPPQVIYPAFLITAEFVHPGFGRKTVQNMVDERLNTLFQDLGKSHTLLESSITHLQNFGKWHDYVISPMLYLRRSQNGLREGYQFIASECPTEIAHSASFVLTGEITSYI